jgi:hypothetical protein
MREALGGGSEGAEEGRVEDGCDAAAGIREENGCGGWTVGHGTTIDVGEEGGLRVRRAREEARGAAVGGWLGGQTLRDAMQVKTTHVTSLGFDGRRGIQRKKKRSRFNDMWAPLSSDSKDG